MLEKAKYTIPEIGNYNDQQSTIITYEISKHLFTIPVMIKLVL